jgi:hypothetical protein
MVQIEYLPLVLTGLGLTASIVYYASVLRNQNKTQKMQMLFSITEYRGRGEGLLRYVKFMQMDWKDFDDFNEKYGFETDPEMWADWYSFLTQFEDYGYMVNQGMIDLEFMYEVNYPSIVKLWYKFKPIFVERRKEEANTEREMFWFQYLAEELERLAISKGIILDYSKQT